MDRAMYDSMSIGIMNVVVERGLALHKMIRLVTLSTSGGGYLNFMGNEFGHPEWIDFPREGNEWSYHYARRQWSLTDNESLRYRLLNLFDRDMVQLIRDARTLGVPWPYLLFENQGDQVLAFERGDLLFIFNFNPTNSYADYGIPVQAGKFKIVLNSDNSRYGGYGLVDESMLYYAQPDRITAPKHLLKLYMPARSAMVFRQIPIKKVHS